MTSTVSPTLAPTTAARQIGECPSCGGAVYELLVHQCSTALRCGELEVLSTGLPPAVESPFGRWIVNGFGKHDVLAMQAESTGVET